MSPRGRLIISLIVLLCAFGASFEMQTHRSTSLNPAAEPAFSPETTGTTTPGFFFVVRDIDGDTIVVNINGTPTTIRLIGVDTPETVDPRKPVECFGHEASAETKSLVEGKSVRLTYDSSQGEFDKYHRTLAYVYLEDGTLLNKFLIEKGYGHEYTYKTPYMYQSEFRIAQQSARAAEVGLWSPTTCNGNTGVSSHEQVQ